VGSSVDAAEALMGSVAAEALKRNDVVKLSCRSRKVKRQSTQAAAGGYGPCAGVRRVTGSSGGARRDCVLGCFAWHGGGCRCAFRRIGGSAGGGSGAEGTIDFVEEPLHGAPIA